MKKYLAMVLLLVCLFLSSSIGVNALSINTYSHTTSTSSNVINLINYAQSFDSFRNADYVAVQTDQNDYYIIWSDNLTYGNMVTGTDVEYIRYYRTGTTGTQNTWYYTYGTDKNFNLNLGHIVTSNIPELGFSSELYDTYQTNQNINSMLIFFGGFLFVIMLLNLRRT